MKLAIAGFLFFAYILFFAAIYTFVIPWDFHHSTDELEKSYEDVQQKVLEMANNKISENFQESYMLRYLDTSGKTQNCDNKKPLSGHLYALKIIRDPDPPLPEKTGLFMVGSPEHSKIILAGNIGCYLKDQPKEEWWQGLEEKVDCLIGPMAWEIERAGSPGYYISCDVSSSEDDDWDVFFFDEEESKYIYHFIEPSKGLPNGLFYRMVYFSAVAATTLGYGDIVPISNRARLLIASQRVFAWLLIGMLGVWIAKKRVA